MMRHLCKKGPNGGPCNNIDLGKPFVKETQCRRCWLYAHDSSYNVACGGDGRTYTVIGEPVPQPPVPPVPRLLGDRIEGMLSLVGVTKDRVSAWLGHECGCTERQRRLNELDKLARVAANQSVEAVRGALKGLLGSFFGS